MCSKVVIIDFYETSIFKTLNINLGVKSLSSYTKHFFISDKTPLPFFRAKPLTCESLDARNHEGS